jgi:hypothetical protein
MARHIARGWGRPWSGAPQDLVRLATEGQQIVQSAAGEGHKCTVTVTFKGRRESSYDSPEEFQTQLLASDIPDIRSVMILYADSPEVRLAATIDFVKGRGSRPLVSVFGDDPALADGLARRLAGIFPGPRWGWQGLRRPGEVTRLARLRSRSGKLVGLAVTVAVTAAITVVVTIYVTKLLS